MYVSRRASKVDLRGGGLAYIYIHTHIRITLKYPIWGFPQIGGSYKKWLVYGMKMVGLCWFIMEHPHLKWMTGWGILWHQDGHLWRENGQRHSAGRSVDVRLGKEKCTKVFHLSPRDRLGPKTEIFSTKLSKKNGDISKM